MTIRPMHPVEMDKVRSAYRSEIGNLRQHKIRSNAETMKGSLTHIDHKKLTAWDLESLRMIDEILNDEQILTLRREIKSVMKSAGKNYELEKELWQRRKK